jgi:hypothetical protein
MREEKVKSIDMNDKKKTRKILEVAQTLIRKFLSFSIFENWKFQLESSGKNMEMKKERNENSCFSTHREKT